MATATQSTSGKVKVGQVLTWSLIAGVISAVINAVIYLLTQSAFEGVIANGQPFSIGPVIGASIVFILIGGIVMLVIDRFVDNTIGVWRNVAMVALVLSLGQPIFLLENGNTNAIISLEIMHIIAGIIAIYLLTTRVKPE